MQLSNCGTALFVNNIDVSKKFWCDVLGLKIDLDFGKNVILESGPTLWEIRESHIIPQRLSLENTRNQSYCRFEVYFETEDIDAVFSALKQHNIKFLHELHEEPWGQRTIRFFDPDNHLIEIGEAMRQFVMRFHNLGYSVKEITLRTSIPEFQVINLIQS
ncbi:MAG TPA: VOC family protein [Bacteroidales bacterium]|nr:VOC family protein [Bacteroidales bacterium]